MGISDYERVALEQIHEWKTTEPSWFERATDLVTWPITKAVKLIGDSKQVQYVMSRTIGGLVHSLNEIAQWSVRPAAIFDEFQKRGINVHSSRDILRLDLEEVDKTIGWLSSKYTGLAGVEGTVTGAVGLPGIPADVASLVALNLRAVGEYATYCGFDVSLQQERLFALNTLSFASSPTDAAKVLTMSQLVRIASDVARKAPWMTLEKDLFVRAIQNIANALGVRLTKAKLAQILPVLGAAIGGGFNAYYTGKVCEAAYNLYRERFLAEKYGPEAVEQTVKPAEIANAVLVTPPDVLEALPTYGSQYHLRRWVNERPTELFDQISAAYAGAGAKPPTKIEWVSPLSKDDYRELEGMEYFKDSDNKPLLDLWQKFWPQSGNPPNWDAWAVVEGPEGKEVLLIEAKANQPELVSPGSGASPDSLSTIKSALAKTRAFLGVQAELPWHEKYYQYCNRLACLYFLNEIAKVPARMLFVYFTGDCFPDGRLCPASEEEWKTHLHTMYEKLGLPPNHPFKTRILNIFPKIS